MKSHTYNYTWPDLLRLLGPPLAPVVLFSLLVHLGAWGKLLPSSRPAYDIDHAILIHKAEAAQKKNAADIVLIGDSSCLMDVSSVKAGELLGRPVLNLGTLSYLDLRAYASLVQHYVASNPGSPRAVVILMHPEALRQVSSESYYTNFLQDVFAGAAPAQLGTTFNSWNSLLGLDEFKARLLTRLLPFPLPGAYAQAYGFTWDLERLLAAQRGSLIDPDPRPFQGNAEYRLAGQLEFASRAFKSVLPKDAKLYVAITPVPEKFAKPGYPALRAEMLKQWSQWLNATPLDLPATMPANYFAKTTHLNTTGVEAYTALLAGALK